MIPDTAIILRVAELRAKARSGNMTFEEMQEGIEFMRGKRAAVTQPTAGSKKRAPAGKKKSEVNSDDLLSELDNM